VLDAELGKRTYLAGDEFGLADLNVASVASWIELMNFDATPYPRVKAWLARCLDRPAAKKVRSMSSAA